MTQDFIRQSIQEGKTFLGIELGSTRIKAVLIDQQHQPIASGSHAWENQLVEDRWTYALEDVWAGLQACYQSLAEDVQKKYQVPLTQVGALGFSAMMHGYLAFDQADKLLVPFRTWRNTSTGPAAEVLTRELGFNIPQRWSVAHLYQAILDGEAHVPAIRYITTLAGYVHWQLTGQKVIGIGDASGMFPIDSQNDQYDRELLQKFDALNQSRGLPYTLEEILPQVLLAGQSAGTLTPEGAKRLDPTGTLQAGVPLCPPEGDAGTGMVATNSVAQYTGNVSAGTSIFSMVVLDKPLGQVYTEIDLVTTPTGKAVAMVHCNNCTSDIDAWAALLQEFALAAKAQCTTGQALDILYGAALQGESHCGGLVSYNYYSGEPITGTQAGRPLLARQPDAAFSLGNFARCLLYSAVATLKIGMDILVENEGVRIDSLTGHGGFFKAEKAGQSVLATALHTPVSLLQTAGEGGPWGMAVLAAYLCNQSGQPLEDYLQARVFADSKAAVLQPDPAQVEGFAQFMKLYTAGLAIEKSAIENL